MLWLLGSVCDFCEKESETPRGKGTGVLTPPPGRTCGESEMARCFKVPIDLTLALIEVHLSKERSDEEMPPNYAK